MIKKRNLILSILVVAVVAFFSGPVTTRSQSGGTLPAFGHVFIVVEENAGFSQTTGSNMPYLTSLYSNTAGLTGVFGGLATNYNADTHPSIGNYMTLSTGQILTNNDSETPSSFPVSANNIALALQNAGKTWKDYHETNGTYYVRHDPLAYMTNINSSNIVSFSQFSSDLASGTLPNLSWIVPNGCDDGHDCSLSTADNWLKSNIGPLLSSALFKKDGLLIVVFDEDSNTGNSCGLTTGTGCGGQVEAVVVSPFVTNVSGGATSSTSYEHENTLRTMAQGLGLTSFPGAAASASAMSDLFTASGGGGGTPLSITTTSLPGGTQGTAYPSTQLGATGGTTPYTWTATGLPSGLSLSSGGVLSGTPSQSGTFTPSFQATDSSAPKQSASATINIQIGTSGGGGGGGTTVSLTPSSLGFTQAVGGTSATQFATLTNPSGGTTVTSVSSAITPTGGPFAFAGVGTCNTGQSLAPGTSCTFSIHFTPAAAQSYTGALTVTNSAGTQTVSLSGTGTSSGGGGTSLSITTTSLPSGTQGQVYPSTQLNATGGSTPYTWTATGLPSSLSLSAGGAISGTPTQSGTFAPVFQVTDSSSTKQTAIATLDISITASSGGGGGGGTGSCNLYVSPSGSDSNSGTSTSSAWQTVEKAFSTVQAGQTVCLMGGTYPIPSTLQSGGYSQILRNSGTASSLITITNYPGQVAIIEGNTRVEAAHVQFQGAPANAGTSQGLVFDGSTTTQALGVIDVMYSHDVTFDHIEIRNAQYHAGLYQYSDSSSGGGYNIHVTGCYIHDNGRPGVGINTDHGIYWDQTQGAGNLIANNLLEHNVSTGVQLYPNTAQVTVEENTIINNGDMGIVVWGSNDTIANNVLAGNGEVGGFTQLVIDLGSNHVIDSNIFWDSNTANQGYTDNTGQTVTHSIVKDPMFVAPGSNNFQLQSASPAINVANTSYQQSIDIMAVARTTPDLGSYEFTSGSGGGGGGGGGGTTVTLLPSSLSFTQAVGGTSATQLATITNTSTTTTVTSLATAITPAGAPFAFAGVGTCTTGQSLAPGASCTFSVNFTPAAAQSYTATLTVTDSAGTQTVSLSGTGTSSGGGGGGGGTTSCNLYVSPSGSDSNSGSSSSSPWKTVQKAFSSASAGQTVCLMGGTYPIPSTLQTGGYSQILNNSGTSASWITITNYPNQVAVIHGNTRVNGSFVKFVGTPLTAPGLVFEGPTGQALGMIDVMNTHDATFDHIEIRNGDYHAAFYQYNGYNIKLLGSYVHDNGRPGQINTDQGVYWDATTGSGNVIANNVVEHNVSSGIQLYPSPSNVTVEENTIVNNGNYGMVVYGSNNAVVNNVFSNNGAVANNPQLKIYKSSGITVDSNILWSTTASQQGYTTASGVKTKPTNTIIKDPMFDDLTVTLQESGHNYHLQTGSPAVGVSNMGYTQPSDKDGVSRVLPVLGAYEQ